MMDANLPFKYCWAVEQEQAAEFYAAEFYATSSPLTKDEYNWVREIAEVTAIDPDYAGYVFH